MRWRCLTGPGRYLRWPTPGVCPRVAAHVEIGSDRPGKAGFDIAAAQAEVGGRAAMGAVAAFNVDLHRYAGLESWVSSAIGFHGVLRVHSSFPATSIRQASD